MRAERRRERGPRSARGGRALLLALLVGCASCGDKNKTVVQSLPRDFVFRPRPSANGGRPVYVLVRSVGESEFLTDGYRKIAGFVYPNSGDPSVLRVMLLWPNREQQARVDVPTGKAVGVYGMFATPGDQWKLLLTQPLKPKSVFRLERNALTAEREPQAAKQKKKK